MSAPSATRWHEIARTYEQRAEQHAAAALRLTRLDQEASELLAKQAERMLRYAERARSQARTLRDEGVSPS